MSASQISSVLVELLVEELPPKSLRALEQAFTSSIAQTLNVFRLRGDNSTVTGFASPRRLAVLISDVLAMAPSREVKEKLVPVSVGYDAEGRPTAALRKKLGKRFYSDAESEAVDVALGQLLIEDGQIYFRSTELGLPIEIALKNAIEKAFNELPIAKVMSYQLEDGWSTVRFVRPVKGLVALYGARPLESIDILGLAAGRTTVGHRFEAARPSIDIRNAESYAIQLADEGAVIASYDERRAEVVRQLAACAAKEGLKPIEDEALLDEVTALVERPNVLTCRFEEDFLAVPQECLILTMKANQKYFPLLDAAGRLTNRFLVVSNIRPEDPSAVIQGNERVVRPRLADAKFFFDQDRKRSLADRVAGLDKVVYHGKLGSQGARVERVRQIARAIAAEMGDHGLVDKVDTAARLAKADLLTDMVGEFPELQGIMGGYYARHDGLGAEIADAIEDHYRPRFAGDALPRNRAGLVVALADKLETLVGLFGIGQVPTGDKDPFALRRHALGVIRMLVEAVLPLDLDTLLALAVPAFGAAITDPRAAVAAFVFDRLAGSLREQGYSAHEVDAVLALAPQRLAEVPRRLEAVRAFAALPEAEALAAANKRIANILKKSAEPVEARVDEALFSEAAERALWADLGALRKPADLLFAAGDYTANLKTLAALRAPVDKFFDDVMVNAEDAKVRANRLGLLKTLHEVMNRVADLSRLSS